MSLSKIARDFERKILVIASNDIYSGLNKIYHGIESIKKQIKPDPMNAVILSTLWKEVNDTRNTLWHAGMKVSEMSTHLGRFNSFLDQLDTFLGQDREVKEYHFEIADVKYNVKTLKNSLSALTRDFIPAAKDKKAQPVKSNEHLVNSPNNYGGFAAPLNSAYNFPTDIGNIINPLKDLGSTEGSGLINELRLIYEQGKNPGSKYYDQRVFWESLEGKQKLMRKVENILFKQKWQGPSEETMFDKNNHGF